MTEKNKQIQKAGDNSQQMQAETINIFTGITEQRAREICKEEFKNFGAVKTQEAFEIAQQRVQRLEDTVIPKMTEIDKALDAFADPAFQFVLRDAQRTAAATERESDYELLSELLVDRVNHGSDRKRSLSISEAIKIVDKIDDDALCGLTLIFAINMLQPVTGNIAKGIDVLSEIFKSFIVCELPDGDEWIYHLELLNTITTNSLGKLKKFADYYVEVFDGYDCVGIEKNSDEYNQAVDILTKAGLSPQLFLVEHELNPKYVRINTRSLKNSKEISINIQNTQEMEMQVNLVNEQFTAIEKIISLYKNDLALLEDNKKRFKEKLLASESVKTVAKWWDSIPCSVNLTSVGTILAHANAQKLNNKVPNIFE